MNDAIALKIACALCHLVEHNDTGELADLLAYNSLLNEPEVKSWIENNQIMLPLRRDGLPQLSPRNDNDQEKDPESEG